MREEEMKRKQTKKPINPTPPENSTIVLVNLDFYSKCKWIKLFNQKTQRDRIEKNKYKAPTLCYHKRITPVLETQIEFK